MSKFLILKFRNAKLFKNGKGCKDKIFDLNETRDRANEQQFVEPITVFQISNLIHILFGERPIPTNRTVFYEKNDYYFEKAKESYIKIIGTKRFNKSKKIEEYITETLITKKAVWNSWNPNVNINWEIIREYIRPENVEWFINEVKEIIKINPYSLTVYEVRKELIKYDITKLITELKNKQLSGLVSFILNPELGKQMTVKEKHTALNVVNGVEKVIVLSGELIIPVNDDDIEKFRNSKGCATILDGGMVWVDSLVDYASEDGFVKVSEISIEKY